jgi:hypothetical protein
MIDWRGIRVFHESPGNWNGAFWRARCRRERKKNHSKAGVRAAPATPPITPVFGSNRLLERSFVWIGVDDAEEVSDVCVGALVETKAALTLG